MTLAITKSPNRAVFPRTAGYKEKTDSSFCSTLSRQFNKITSIKTSLLVVNLSTILEKQVDNK